MSCHSKFSLALLLAGCSAGPVELSPDDGELTRFAWLSGSWAGTDGGALTEEHWTAPRGGTMVGVQRITKGGNTTGYEHLRIEQREDGVVYVASPRGQQTTTFRLVDSGEGFARFVNPEHDFPQVIQYRREGDQLTATVEGLVNGEARLAEWVLHRARIVER